MTEKRIFNNMKITEGEPNIIHITFPDVLHISALDVKLQQPKKIYKTCFVTNSHTTVVTKPHETNL